MRLHGLVSLTFFASSSIALGQEPLPLPPAPASSPATPGLSNLADEPSGRNRTTSPAADPSTLEGELEALRAELEAFHALSDEVTRETRNAESDAERTLHRHRQELLDLLTRLATQSVNRKSPRKHEETKPALATEPTVPVVPESIESQTPPVTDAAIDQFALGKVLFRAGDYVKAEQAFRKVAQTPDNQLMLKYLIATCLRKRSQWQAAMDAYNDIAASDQDPVLRDLAKFQLDGIRWTQETEKQIEQLRKQREIPTAKPPSKR